MSWHINPVGEGWKDGIFAVPKSVADRLKFPSEEQLKVLLFVLSDGKADVSALKSFLAYSEHTVLEALAFWENEGVLISDEPQDEIVRTETKSTVTRLEALPMPSLTGKDIVAICNDNPAIAQLLRSADKILSGNLSAVMKSNIVNMVTYYGLPVPVVVTLLEYYKTEREAGKNITTRTLQQLAKEWADDGVTTLEMASAKLQERTGSEDFWNEILALCEFEYKKPTSARLKMMSRWLSEYDKRLIYFACNTMKKYNEEDKRSLKIVDNILKDWKRRGFALPEDVKEQDERKDKKEAKPSSKKLRREPSFDVDELKRKAMLNDDFDI